jgi:hypothetical protein
MRCLSARKAARFLSVSIFRLDLTIKHLTEQNLFQYGHGVPAPKSKPRKVTMESNTNYKAIEEKAEGTGSDWEDLRDMPYTEF